MHYELTQIVERFFKSADSVDPLDNKDQSELKRETKRLDIIEKAIDKFIFDYGIEKSEDIIDTEDRLIIRMFVLSKGLTEHLIMINSNGEIVVCNDDILSDLLDGLGNIIKRVIS